jgi:hypothetical protein
MMERVEIRLLSIAISALIDAFDRVLSEKLMLGERQKLRLTLENCCIDPARLGTPSLTWMSVCKQFLCPDQDQLSPFVHLCTACGSFERRYAHPRILSAGSTINRPTVSPPPIMRRAISRNSDLSKVRRLAGCFMVRPSAFHRIAMNF